MILLVWAWGCVTEPTVAPPPPGELTTAGGHYRLVWTPVPKPVPLAELFEVQTKLLDARTGAPVEDGSVHVDARMPQHGHGMATKPEDDPGVCPTGAPKGSPDCRHPGGVYVTRGMKFHMMGSWTMTFDVTGPAGADRVETEYRL